MQRVGYSGIIVGCGHETRLHIETVQDETPNLSIALKILANKSVSDLEAVVQSITAASVKKQLNIVPKPFTCIGTDQRAAMDASSSISNAVCEAVLSHISLFNPKSSVARPARTATGFPESVPAWYTGPSGANPGHYVRSSSVGSDRKPSSNYFTECC